MSVLVTGGAGFVGSHFIELLLQESDHTIVCLDNFNDYYDPQLKRANVAGLEAEKRVSIVEADFCDQEAMIELFRAHQVRRVVHLGAYAGVSPSVANPIPYQRVNVGGTLSLLEAARRRPLERFLLVSSSTVYGRGAGVPFCEDRPLGIPISPYGATKRAAELMGLCYHALHGLPVVCLRPFSIYGPRVRPDLAVAIFARAIEEGRPFPLYGDGTIRRDFTHVSDICRGLLAALRADNVAGETINLGHHEPVEMRRLISLLEQAVGRKALIDRRHAREEDLPVTCADLTKAKRLLGYQPRVTLEEGIADYIDCYRGAR